MARSVVEMTDDELRSALGKAGTKRALAKSLKMNESTMKYHLKKRGIEVPAVIKVQAQPVRASRRPRLTLDALHAAIEPPNNCPVKRFRDKLDEDSKLVFDEALSYDKRDLPAPRLREFLIRQGFSESAVPGTAAINAHRTGSRPCRCKG